MSGNDQHAKRFSVLGRVSACLLAGYAIWAVWSAYRHGVLAWGATGSYSPFVYVLILGLLCSGFVFAQGRTGSVRPAFLLLFLGYGRALISARPAEHMSADMSWLFNFIGYTTAFAVITAGLVLEERIRGSR